MWKNSINCEEDELGSSYGSYQNSLPSTSTTTVPIPAIDIESNSLTNERDEASTALFSKKVKISAGFIMGVSSLFLISIGLLALNSHSITLGGAGEAQTSVSSSSSVSTVDTSVVYACKTTCDDPCSTYQSAAGTFCCEYVNHGGDHKTNAVTISDGNNCFCAVSPLDFTTLKELVDSSSNHLKKKKSNERNEEDEYHDKEKHEDEDEESLLLSKGTNKKHHQENKESHSLNGDQPEQSQQLTQSEIGQKWAQWAQTQGFDQQPQFQPQTPPAWQQWSFPWWSQQSSLPPTTNTNGISPQLAVPTEQQWQMWNWRTWGNPWFSWGPQVNSPLLGSSGPDASMQRDQTLTGTYIQPPPFGPSIPQAPWNQWGPVGGYGGPGAGTGAGTGTGAGGDWTKYQQPPSWLTGGNGGAPTTATTASSKSTTTTTASTDESLLLGSPGPKHEKKGDKPDSPSSVAPADPVPSNPGQGAYDWSQWMDQAKKYQGAGGVTGGPAGGYGGPGAGTGAGTGTGAGGDWTKYQQPPSWLTGGNGGAPSTATTTTSN